MAAEKRNFTREIRNRERRTTIKVAQRIMNERKSFFKELAKL